MTRREALVAPLPLMAAQAPKRAIRLGAPIYLKSDDPAELAREHRRLGYGAAYCPRVNVRETERIRAIEAAFRAENVMLAEVGVWVNLMDRDPAKRSENLAKVTEGLALADAVGARCCVDIAGSFHEKVWYGPHPKNFSKGFFDAAVENARKIIDAVKPKRAKFAYEMMGWCLPHDADSYLALLRAIDRSGFGVHVDVCNGINSPQRFYDNAAFARELFTKLGRWVVSCHAKDLAWLPEMNVHFVEVIPGRGEIDYRGQLAAIAALPNDAPLMLEHLKTAEEYAEGAKWIRGIGNAAGVSFV